ncbi:uncharacterized protein [Vicugna pacos]|uniref:Uncharacterized protein n=1 Tax=Vicugna pacos TaxID=30538 RepID=A0ABM5CX23_VICPA
MKPVLPRASLPTETPVEAYQWMSHIRASGMIPQTDLGFLGAVPCRCHPKCSICFWEIMLKEMLHLLTLWTWTTLPCPLILVARVHEGPTTSNNALQIPETQRVPSSVALSLPDRCLCYVKFGSSDLGLRINFETFRPLRSSLLFTECKAVGTLIRGGACPSRTGFIAAQTSGILDPFLEQRIEELPQVHVGTPYVSASISEVQ